MKKFETPVVEIATFAIEDVVTTSVVECGGDMGAGEF